MNSDFNLWEGTELDGLPTRKTDAPSALRIPDKMPEDIDAERSFLSTCCSTGAEHIAAQVVFDLEDDAFVHPAHKYIFQSLKILLADGVEVSSLSLKASLETRGKLNLVGGFTGLVDILSFEDVERPGVLADILTEKLKLRRLIKVGSDIVASALDPAQDYHQTISLASESITRLALAHPGKHIITDMTDLLDDLSGGAHITTENGGMAMSWGDDTLDRLCPIPRGEPTIVCARPGGGKSALAIQILVATVEKGLGKPLFISLEMGREKVKARLAAHLSGLNSRSFRDGDYGSNEIESIIDRKRVLSGMRVMFPMQQCRVEEIESLVKHAVEIHGVTAVVLDQFSHVGAPREGGRDTYAIVNAQISKHLTALAKNLNLGWVTLAQINKDGDDNRRPTMKDLAATDRIAQDAAVILGLWNKGSDDNQEVWGTIMKNRDDGMKGWARQMDTDYGTCRFRVQEQETFVPKKRFA